MSAPSVSVTDRAAERIKRILASETAGAALRISVKGGGCSGFQYVFDVDGSREADDLAIEKNGATVLIDATSLPFLEGATVDFVTELIGQSFRIENPNASASCGCGTSFTV